MFKSQIYQDRWVLDKLNYKQNGYFVEIGAYDGITLSNTYAMEKYFGWSGICVECNPFMQDKLRSNRECHICDNGIWIDNDRVLYYERQQDDIEMLGFVSNRITQYPIKTITLNTLLQKYNAPKHIDYISLDIEGVERQILESFNFEEYDVKCWTIEHNINPDNQNSINNFLSIVKKLLDNNYLVKWHEWDVFAIKDTFETQYFKHGQRVK